MTSIAAIPTTYRGYRFRSRLEARWAVFFDMLGVPFEYELQGYATSEGWYLPDFWFPDLHMFGEVKPTKPDRLALAKCAAVAHGTDFPFVMLVGTPEIRAYQTIRPSGNAGEISLIQLMTSHWILNGGAPQAFNMRAAKVRMHEAVDAARGARFDSPLVP